MQKYKKTYLKAFGYDVSDPTQFVKSELSGKKAVDIHHIIGRGRGGDDRIENLIALTRKEHIDFGDKNKFVWTLLSVHRQSMKESNVEFDNDWIEETMLKYAYETDN